MNSESDTSKRRADQSHDLQSHSCEPWSQRQRCTHPATPSTAHVMSTDITARFVGESRSSRPSSSEAGDRLPSVQQLLLPHSFTGPAQSTSVTSYQPRQPHPFPCITIPPLTKSLPSSLTKASDVNTKISLPEAPNPILPAGQRLGSTSLDADRAFNNKRKHDIPATPQPLPRMVPYTDSMSSPQSSKYSVLQTYGYPRGSPKSTNISQREAYGTFTGQQSDLRDVHYATSPQVYSGSWQTSHNRLDWGTTKAGKPRKRLAQACLNCRQKKIRCCPNPAATTCLQCEKSGSDCKYEGGSRPSNHVTGSRSDCSGASFNLASSAGETQNTPNIANCGRSAELQVHTGSSLAADEQSPLVASARVSDHDGRLLKRQKRESESADNKIILGIPESRRSSKGLSPILNPPPVCAVIDTLGLAAAEWSDDPYDVSPLTMEYLNLYFNHINQATYCMLPKLPFLKWVCEHHKKSPDDKMILYSLMAMGCRFSERKESIAHSKRLLQIARQAEQSSFGRFTLQLAQTRLILSLLSFSLGKSSEAWDYCGTAVRAVCGLKYNTEDGIVGQTDMEDCEYGLNKETMAECRRRTFWSACVMERFNGFCSGHLSTLHQDDCFLRLPCREDLYEIQNVPDTPYCTRSSQAWTRQEQDSLGNMAFLVAISSTWNDVLQYLYRTQHRVVRTGNSSYESFYRETQRRLQAFTDHLPSHLYPCNTPNMEQALDGGYIGTFTSLYALYHTTLMKLNRHAEYMELHEEGLRRNIRAAQYHARELLKVTQTLAALHRKRASSELTWIFSAPFHAYSILSAVDILTSLGSLADLKSDLDLVQSSLEVVQELGRYWASAEKQLEMIAVRFRDIMSALESASTTDTDFVTTDPMEDIFGRGLDLLFSPPVEARLRALGLDPRTGEGSHLLAIGSVSPGVGGYGS